MTFIPTETPELKVGRAGSPVATETQVLFHNVFAAFQIERITFRNFYTASVAVRLLRGGPGQEAAARWCTALEGLRLMDDPHTEGGSQDHCCLHRTQVLLAPPPPPPAGL